ncbi:MAG TPA: type II toxin-antitoxin system PemK/MazF family toxin [Gemmataceae bacterium]|jgi:mRNA interferase MazF|nr:type II toxin-antitoxin system PemK/MazF family toxin [Gemmataceae bacterium]
MADPVRGEVWLADLGATRGHEQAGRRPVLIISVDAFNAGLAGLVIVLPLTSTVRPLPAHVPVTPPEGGLRRPSAILCDAIRSVTKNSLISRWGTVSAATMAKAEAAARVLLGL